MGTLAAGFHAIKLEFPRIAQSAIARAKWSVGARKFEALAGGRSSMGVLAVAAGLRGGGGGGAKQTQAQRARAALRSMARKLPERNGGEEKRTIKLARRAPVFD